MHADDDDVQEDYDIFVPEANLHTHVSKNNEDEYAYNEPLDYSDHSASGLSNDVYQYDDDKGRLNNLDDYYTAASVEDNDYNDLVKSLEK